MPRQQPDGRKRTVPRNAWYQFGAFLTAVGAAALVLDLLGMSRLEIYGVIVGAVVAFGLIKVAVSRVRADQVERKRWSYRAHHDGGGGLGPPADPWRGLHRDE